MSFVFRILGCALATAFFAGCSGDASDTDEVGTSSEELIVGTSPSDQNIPAAFDVLSFGISRGVPFVRVRGEAGSVRPIKGSGVIYAYVFVTDAGIYADTSHEAEDSTEVKNDLRWHAHRVTLDANNCVTQLEENGDARMEDSRAAVSNTGASSVSKVLVATLANVTGGTCVTKVWDSAGQ